MSRIVLFSFLSLVLFTSQVRAQNCYSAQEAEAEQGIRIHSELMVIGLNCQHMTPAGWTNFYAQYRQITNRHADLFAGYENTLISYWSKNGAANPEGRLHDLRTRFANKVSTDAARMRPDLFCANYAPRIPKAAEMSRSDFRRWASTFHQGHPVSQPICEQ